MSNTNTKANLLGLFNTARAELEQARAEASALRVELHERKAHEAAELDRAETPEDAKELAHRARHAAAVAAYTFALWCERQAEAEPTEANERQAQAAREVAELAAAVGYAR